MKRLFKSRMFISVSLSAVLTFAFVFAVAYSATTISTNIETAGTLTVTGTSALTGAVTVGSNIISDTTSTDNLGSSGVRWLATYSDNFTGNTITLDGATGINILTIPTNKADALSIIDSAGDLMVFTTTTGGQVLTITPRVALTYASTTNITSLTGAWFATTGGKVGVGTTSPWASLAVNPTAGNASNRFVVGSSTATSFVIDNSGNVGIGTSTPSAELSVTGAATTTLYLESSAKGGCIELKDSQGTGIYRMYIVRGSTATTTPAGEGFIAVWELGACK